MSKYKIGDKVTVKMERSLQSGLRADLMTMLMDRDIDGKEYDKLGDALYAGKPFVITEIDDEGMYGMKLAGKGKQPNLHAMLEEDDLCPS